jgi:hypothetical protein
MIILGDMREKRKVSHALLQSPLQRVEKETCFLFLYGWDALFIEEKFLLKNFKNNELS